jgi:hypothetical protein
LKVQWVVRTLHADMTFLMDIKFVGSKFQVRYFPGWSMLSELELEARCRSELFALKDAAIFHDGDERRHAARLGGTAALENSPAGDTTPVETGLQRMQGSLILPKQLGDWVKISK